MKMLFLYLWVCFVGLFCACSRKTSNLDVRLQVVEQAYFGSDMALAKKELEQFLSNFEQGSIAGGDSRYD